MAFTCHVVDDYILHILTQYKLIIGRIGACHNISIKIFTSNDIKMTKHAFNVVCNIWSLGPIEECDICWRVLSDCTITKLGYHVVGIHQSGQRGKSYEKKCSLHLIFTFYINRHISGRIIPCHCACISIKADFKWAPCWLIDWKSKPSLKLLGCCRKIQNDVHISINIIANQNSHHDYKST